jgi:hypothetical protein
MKIVLGTFKDQAKELADFLGPRLGDVPAVSGGELNFDDDKMKKTVRSRHVKTYIKRYLNRKGERQNYQILVTGRELRLIEYEAKKEEEKEKEDKKRGQPKAEAKGKDEEGKAEGEPEEAPAPPTPEKESDTPAEDEPAKPKKTRKASQKEDVSASTSS